MLIEFLSLSIQLQFLDSMIIFISLVLRSESELK